MTGKIKEFVFQREREDRRRPKRKPAKPMVQTARISENSTCVQRPDAVKVTKVDFSQVNQIDFSQVNTDDFR